MNIFRCLWIMVLFTAISIGFTRISVGADQDTSAMPSTQLRDTAVESDEAGEFKTTVANEIADIVLSDSSAISLVKPKETSFVFYGEVANKYEHVKCEKSIIFSIKKNTGIAGKIGAGICQNEAMRMHNLAGHAKAGIRQSFEMLVKGGANFDEAKASKLGWSYSKKTDSNGSIIHAFPIIAVGHGVMTVPTVLLVTKQKNQVIIVQSEVTNLCDGDQFMKDKIPLCRDTKAALVGIAQRLHLRFGEK